MAKNKNESIAPVAQEGDLGSLLVEIRENAGLTIAQVADAMCLSEETIKLLEQENFDKLAEPPYIRGYLRNYAKLADADSDELITRYESLRGADPRALNYHFKTSAKIHSQNKRGLSPVLLQLLLLSLLIAVLAGISMIPAVNSWVKDTWNSFSNQTSSQSISSVENPLLTGTMPVPSPLPVSSADTTTDKKASESAANSSQSSSDPAIETKIIADNKQADGSLPKPIQGENAENIIVDSENKTPKDEARIPDSLNETIRLKLVFNKEVWMRIRDGKKKTVFEGQNPAGAEKVLDLKKPLIFRVGNAQGLTLFVDDKKVDISSYTKGSVANFTLE